MIIYIDCQECGEDLVFDVYEEVDENNLPMNEVILKNKNCKCDIKCDYQYLKDAAYSEYLEIKDDYYNSMEY